MPAKNSTKPQLRIYDLFPFFNELELLEIRLHELDPVVDIFVLVEAKHTFQKKPKELLFQQNRERFAPFLPKIRHIVVEKLPSFFYKWRIPNAWDVSDYQKGQAARGLFDAQVEDRIIFSDVDEIPRAEAVREFAHKPGITVFEQRLYAYYLNNLCVFYDTHGKECVAQYTRDGIGWWRGSVMLDFATFCRLGKSIKKMRLLHDLPEPQVQVAQDAGWHFTSIGDVERIIRKLESYEHSEANTEENKNRKRMQERIASGKSIFSDNKSRFRPVPLDDSFPQYLVQNQQKFRHLLCEPAAL